MKIWSKAFTLLLVGMICLSLTACGGFAKDDAATLVKGDIESVYMNKHSEDYLSLCNTTKEERTSVYEASMENEADYFISYFEFDSSMVDSATYDRIVQLYKDIYSHAKFEVGEVSQSGDNYLVSLTIYPIDIFEKVINEDYDGFYSTYEEKYNDDSVSAEDLEAFWQDGILKLFEARLSSIGYLDPVTLSVQVVPAEEEGSTYYSVDTNDAETINTSLISYNF